MLIDLHYLIKKYNIILDGIIHVGGHIGEEITLYKTYTNNIHVFEPQKDCFEKIDCSVKKYNFALGSKEENGNMFISNNKQSSSLLKPKDHLLQHPDVTFSDNNYEVMIKKLDSFCIKNCNFMNIDVQGYELEVLKGSHDTLSDIEYIYTEINKTELYDGCVLLEDLDLFLKKYKFTRAEIKMCDHFTWGDAFYIKEGIK